MLAKLNSVGIHGMDGYLISVQVDECNGLPRSIVVGNVSASVREALDRCQVALRNSGIPLPPKRLTINLQPADVRKEGSCFDLPILAGIMRALDFVPYFPLDNYGFLGEVGLDGQIRHVRGILSLVTTLKDNGFIGAVVPMEDVQEALVVEGMDIIGVSHLKELSELISSEDYFNSYKRPVPEKIDEKESYDVDFKDVHGQAYSVRAALIAASGGHNLLLSGAAGSGKSMIAKRIPSIMPDLTREENIAITKVYSIAGLLKKGRALYNQRPFRSPHHSITTAALIGGCSQGTVIPGEMSLASNGVLFLDELPLFSRSSIEALRQPMEDRKIVINRLKGVFTYPADCLIVAAMNPCPCGFYPDRTRCKCTPGQIRTYQRGISKPILERLDLCVEVRPVSFKEALYGTESAESSESLREKVSLARSIQKKRFKNSKITHLNGQMGIHEIGRYCSLGSHEQKFMQRIFDQKQLSMRTYHKLLKVSRTIADLDGQEEIQIKHLSEAIGYRSLEDNL